MQRRCTYHLNLLLACCIAATQPASTRADEAPAPAPAKQTKITVSKETTYVLGPLDEQGYVDYVAALNGLAKRGVTPENNAAVLYWQAIGPGPLEPLERDGFFRELGITPPPEEGEYFLSLYDAQKVFNREQVNGVDELQAELDIARKRPWTTGEFPLLARWIARNSRPLELVLAGTQRPEYYSPMIRSSDDGTSLESSLPVLPGMTLTKEFAMALTARAMLRSSAGQVDAAWQDLLACHRLSRHVAGGPTLVEALVGIAINQMACTADAALIHHAQLDREQLQRMAADIAAVAPLPSIAAKLDHAARFAALDAAGLLARAGTKHLLAMCRMFMSLDGSRVVQLDIDSGPLAAELGVRQLDLLVDWDEVLRSVNARFDRLIDVVSLEDPSSRFAELAAFQAEMQKLRAEANSAPAGLQILLQPASTATNKVETILSVLLLAGLDSAASADLQDKATLRATQIAFALSAYRSEHGRYPQALADLTAQYLSDLPTDPFNGKSFQYRAEGDTALIYSVDNNLRDDHGDDSRRDTGGDDIVLRLPPKLE